jgi:hypothetical protein
MPRWAKTALKYALLLLGVLAVIAILWFAMMVYWFIYEWE